MPPYENEGYVVDEPDKSNNRTNMMENGGGGGGGLHKELDMVVNRHEDDRKRITFDDALEIVGKIF